MGIGDDAPPGFDGSYSLYRHGQPGAGAGLRVPLPEKHAFSCTQVFWHNLFFLVAPVVRYSTQTKQGEISL
jgi:hypothetical protein